MHIYVSRKASQCMYIYVSQEASLSNIFYIFSVKRGVSLEYSVCIYMLYSICIYVNNDILNILCVYICPLYNRGVPVIEACCS